MNALVNHWMNAHPLASSAMELTWSQNMTSALQKKWPKIHQSLCNALMLILDHVLSQTANGEKERLSPLTMTSTSQTKISLLPTSAIHQPPITGNKLHQNALPKWLNQLVKVLNASGQLDKNWFQIPPISALPLKSLKMPWPTKPVLTQKIKLLALLHYANGSKQEIKNSQLLMTIIASAKIDSLLPTPLPLITA